MKRCLVVGSAKLPITKCFSMNWLTKQPCGRQFDHVNEGALYLFEANIVLLLNVILCRKRFEELLHNSLNIYFERGLPLMEISSLLLVPWWVRTIILLLIMYDILNLSLRLCTCYWWHPATTTQRCFSPIIMELIYEVSAMDESMKVWPPVQYLK